MHDNLPSTPKCEDPVIVDEAVDGNCPHCATYRGTTHFDEIRSQSIDLEPQTGTACRHEHE
jgi:hypothetical protein